MTAPAPVPAAAPATDLAEFMSTLPFFTVANFPPAASLRDQLKDTDAVVVGTIRGVDLSDEQVHSRTQVVCEADEGVPIPGDCFVESRTVGLSLTVSIDTAYEPDSTSLAGDGADVVVQMPLTSLATPLDLSRARARELLGAGEALLRNQQVVLILSAKQDGIGLTSNASVAVVGLDGGLVDTPFYSGDKGRGIGEVKTLSELETWLTTQGGLKRR